MADGSVTIEVTLNKEQLEKGLKSVKSDLNSLSKLKTSTMLGGIGNTLNSLGGTATKTGKIITAATAGVVAGLGSAIGRFDTLKNYPKVMENLGFSAKESKKSIQDLSKGIDGLPTSLNDAASSVQRLTAKNGDINKSTKYFLAMNDAIIAGNAPIEKQKTAIEQLIQSYSKGKPDMQDWKALMEAMSGQLKQVATSMGYANADKLYDALKNGKISMEQFMDQVVKLDKEGGKGIMSFQQQAKNSCDSIGTAIENVKNRFTRGFEAILGGLDAAAGGTQFKSIASMINSFSSSVAKFLTKIGDAVKKNEAVRKFISQLGAALDKLMKTVENLSPQQADKLVTAFVNFAKAGPILLAVGKGCTTLGGAFNSLSKIVGPIEKMFVGLAGSGPKVAKGFGSAFGTIKSAITATGGVVKQFNSGIGGMFSTLLPNVTSGLGSFGNAVKTGFLKPFDIAKTGVMSGVSKIQGGLMSVVGKMPIGVADGLSKIGGAFSTAFGGLSSTVGPLLQTFSGVLLKGFGFASVIGLVVAGLGIIQGQFGDKINEIAQKMITEGPTIIQNLVSGILLALPQLMEQGQQLITTIINVITANLPTLISSGIQILASLVIGIAQMLPTLIPQALEMILTIVESLLDNIDLIIDAGIQLIIGLAEGLINAIPKLIEKAPVIISKLINAIAKNLPKIIQAGIKLIVMLAKGLIQAIPQLVSKIPQIIKALLNGFKAMLSGFGEVGKNIIDGIWKRNTKRKKLGNWKSKRICKRNPGWHEKCSWYPFSI